jgi:hypothetical protein
MRPEEAQAVLVLLRVDPWHVLHWGSPAEAAARVQRLLVLAGEMKQERVAPTIEPLTDPGFVDLVMSSAIPGEQWARLPRAVIRTPTQARGALLLLRDPAVREGFAEADRQGLFWKVLPMARNEVRALRLLAQEKGADPVLSSTFKGSV